MIIFEFYCRPAVLSFKSFRLNCTLLVPQAAYFNEYQNPLISSMELGQMQEQVSFPKVTAFGSRPRWYFSRSEYQ